MQNTHQNKCFVTQFLENAPFTVNYFTAPTPARHPNSITASAANTESMRSCKSCCYHPIDSFTLHLHNNSQLLENDAIAKKCYLCDKYIAYIFDLNVYRPEDKSST